MYVGCMYPDPMRAMRSVLRVACWPIAIPWLIEEMEMRMEIKHDDDEGANFIPDHYNGRACTCQRPASKGREPELPAIVGSG